MSLASALERAAGALPAAADAIRPANGDPDRLLDGLRPDEAQRLLGWLLTHEVEAGEELLAAWVEGESGVKVVLAAPDAGLPKAGRKALRRARHQLRGRGIVVSEPEPAPTVARLPAVDDDLSAAAVTALDPSGACLVYLAERNPSGGARLFEVALDEGRGLLEFEVYSAGRSQVRGFLREILGRGRLPAVEAPPEAIRALIARAAGAHPEDRPLPSGFGEWRSKLARGADPAEAPDVRVAGALEPGEPGSVEAVVERVRAGELGPWVPGESLRAAAERLSELSEQRIIVSAAQRRSQADEILGESLDALFADGGGATFARRFRHAAFVAWQRDQEEEARALLAAAAVCEGAEAARSPLARALLELPLAGLLAKLETEEETPGASSLLVTPGGA